jgi:BppU N-terminal domain
VSTNMYLGSLTGNLMSYGFQVLWSNGTPFDLTDLAVEFYLKASSGDPDSSGMKYAIGSGITFIDITQGTVQVTIPAEDLGIAEDAMWFHLDVVDPADDTNRQTAIDGIFGVNTN